MTFFFLLACSVNRRRSRKNQSIPNVSHRFDVSSYTPSRHRRRLFNYENHKISQLVRDNFPSHTTTAQTAQISFN